MSGSWLFFELDGWWREVVLVDCGVGLDAVAAVRADDEEEGTGHIAVGEADAGVEVELAFFGSIEAQAVHDAVFLEVIGQLRLEVGFAETAIEKLFAVLRDDEFPAVVCELHSVLVLNDIERGVGFS